MFSVGSGGSRGAPSWGTGVGVCCGWMSPSLHLSASELPGSGVLPAQTARAPFPANMTYRLKCHVSFPSCLKCLWGRLGCFLRREAVTVAWVTVCVPAVGLLGGQPTTRLLKSRFRACLSIF